MANPKIVLAELDIDIKALLAAALQSKDALAKLKTELLALKDAGDTTSARFRGMQADMQQLTTVMNEQLKVLKEQVKKNEDLAESQQEVVKSAKKAANAQEDLAEAYQEAAGQIEGLSDAAQDAAGVVAGLNAEVEKNNALMAQEGAAKQVQTFNDYKNKVIEAAQSINIFNGGFGGFLSRAQEAGGVGKLFKNAMDTMKTGIEGMGTAFKANPVGAILTLLAPIITMIVGQLQKFAPITNAVEKAMAGLGPVINVLTMPIKLLGEGIAFLINTFADLLGSMSSAADEAMKLRDAQALLDTQMALQEERNDKAKKQMDELIAKSKDQTLSEGERLKALQDAAKVEMNNYNERQRLANETYRVKLATMQQEKELSDAELEILQNGTAAQIVKLQQTKGITADELKTLQDAEVAKQRIAGEERTILERQAADRKAWQAKIDADNAAAAKKVSDDRKKLADDALEDQRQRLDLFESEKKGRGKTLDEQLQYEKDYAQEAINILRKQLDLQEISWKEYQTKVNGINEDMKQNQLDINRTAAELELDQLIADQGFKAKTLEEEVILAQQVADKKLAIAQMELDAHKDNANAQAKFNLEKTRIDTEVAQKQAELAVDNARRELEAFKQNKDNQLSISAITNADMLAAEKKKLDALSEQEIVYQKENFEQKLISQQDYDDAVEQINADNLAKSTALDEKFKQDKNAKDVIDLENKRLANTANMEYDMATQLANLNAQKAQELEAAEKTGADTADIDAKYAKLKQETEEAVMANKLQLANQTFGNIAAIVGKESAVGKAMAVAQATIDTYQAATAAYKAMAGIPVVGPALGGVAAAAAVAAGIQNVKKITATKTPKAEKGALFNIGGNRHSNGGTLFTGADGTRFEAEQGELIGVMNRNAAHHFMAFNNAFPAGGSTAPNYFANGGIVSREIAQQQLNVDELAAKIALANSAIPAPVVAVQDIITQGNSYVRVRDGANF